MNLSGFVFTEMPVQYGQDDYSRAREIICDYYAGLPGVKSIYEYGSVRAPGFSDLDLILVTGEHADNMDSRIAKDYPHEVQYFTGGISKIMNEDVFRGIRLLHHVPRLRKLHGEDIEVDDIPENLESWNKLSNIIDFLPTRLLAYLRIFTAGVIPVVETVGFLYSLGYSVQLVGEITSSTNEEWENFRERVNSLRENWFELADEERQPELLALLADGIIVCYELLENISSFIADGKVFPIDIPPRAFIQYDNGVYFFFSENWRQYPMITANERGKSLISRLLNPPRIYLPGFYYYHLSHYAGQPGLMSRQIKKSLYPSPRKGGPVISEPFGEFGRRKMAVCNDLAQFLVANGIRQGVFIFKNFLPRRPESTGARLALLRDGAVLQVRKAALRTD